MKVMLVGLLKSISVLPFFLSVIILHLSKHADKQARSIAQAHCSHKRRTSSNHHQIAGLFRPLFGRAVPNHLSPK